MTQQTCAWCEHEFGVKVKDPDTSHGICARHVQEQIDQMKDMMEKANIPAEVIEQRLEMIQRKADEGGGAADMAKTGIPSNAVPV